MSSKISNGGLKEPIFDLVIIDGRNRVYAYGHTMSYLRNSNGKETGIFHGFLSMICSMKIKYPRARIVVAWEGGMLVRKQMSDSYKNNRPEKKSSRETAILELKDLLGLMGIEQKFAPGYEADDVAAVLASDVKVKTLLVTEDRDWYQIMHTNCWVSHKNKVLSFWDVKELEGYPPSRFDLYVLLKGKKANNTLGIPGFPTLLAKRIINESQHLRDIFKFQSDESSDQKWLDLIKSQKNEMKEKHEMTKLRNDVRLEDVKCQTRNQSHLKKLLLELQLSKVLELMKKANRLKKCTYK